MKRGLLFGFILVLITISFVSAKVDIDIQRRHAQIQVALVLIGHQLNFRIWVAQNDKGIVDTERTGFDLFDR